MTPRKTKTCCCSTRESLQYLLLSSCVFAAFLQFRHAHRLVRLIGKNDSKSAFLPEWNLTAAKHYWSSWWHFDEDNEADLDDDNVFDDDNNGQEETEGDDYDKSAKEVENELKKLRLALDQYAQAHGGKVEMELMKRYNQGLRIRRKFQLENRRQQAQIYYDKTGKKEGGDVDFLATSMKTLSELKWERKERSKPPRVDWFPPGYNTTDYAQYPTLPTERTLPDMSVTGGVILFLHVPKTGGQTIRQLNPRFRKELRRRGKTKLLDSMMATNIGSDVLMPGMATPAIPPEAKELHDLCVERVRYVLANTLENFQRKAVPQVNYHFNKTTHNHSGEVLFVEVHGMDNYHTFELEPFIHYWREQSQLSGVPFFAFTIVREALSLQVSFFNYYFIHPGDKRFCINPLKPHSKCMEDRKDKFLQEKYGRHEKQALREARDARIKESYEHGITGVTQKVLEDAMLQLAYDNPQCLFLARGERSFGDDPDPKLHRRGLGRNECQKAYLSLQRTMDWIGRTETISDQLLPLLANIMFRKPQLGKYLPKANESPRNGGWVKLSKAAPSTIQRLQRMSEFDQEIYHRVMNDYTTDQWDLASEIQ